MIDRVVQNTEQHEILIVDDTPDSLELLSRMLKERGYRVRPATNGRDALKSVAARLPDLVLLEVKMPDMDGYEVCRRLKAGEQSRDIPVVFVSAYGETANKGEGFEAGGVDYIAKPFEREEVLARVETQLRLRRLTEHLEEEVSLRTAELALANRQLLLAHRDLEESEERMRLTLVAAEIGIFDWDVQHDTWYASPECYTMLGYEPKEGPGDRKEWMARVHPDDRTHVEAEIRRVLRRDASPDRPQGYRYEARLRHADGGYRWQQVQGLGIKRDPEGRVTRMLGIRMDINEQKEAEQERAAHQHFLESMGSTSRAIRSSDGLERMMTDALDMMLSIFDCDRAWLVHPCDPDAPSWSVPMERTKPEYPGVHAVGQEVPMGEDVAEAFRTQLSFEGPVKFGPGTERPLPEEVSKQFGIKSFISMALHPKVGKPWQFGLHQCSHPRRWTAAEENLFQEIGIRIEDSLTSLLSYCDLQESEARFRTVVENSPIVVFSFDRNGVFILSEGKGLEKLGLAPGQVVGKSVFEVFGHNPRVMDHFNRALAGEDMIATDEEAGFTYETRWTPIRGDDGDVVGVIGVSVDITERKEAEEALRQLNMELDQRILDRTAELETANRELEGFTYSVSHDLRAPLRHIDSFLELLRKRAGTALDDEARHYMDTVSGAARKMGLLVDELLAFTRMGHHAVTLQQVDLGSLVHGVLGELGPDTAGRNIDWRIGDLPVVSGDGAMLRMVLYNLIANAVKFTQLRPQAKIEIGCVGSQKAETVVFVRDNGVGFDMTYGDKLFGVFQRLHGPEEFEGTGIGLANVRRIISRHGGRTWAEGKVDQGATFYFSLPQTIQDAKP